MEVIVASSDASVTDPGTAPAADRRTRRASATPQPYDFRRPIQLSREHSRMLQLAFDDFCRQATTVATKMMPPANANTPPTPATIQPMRSAGAAIASDP